MIMRSNIIDILLRIYLKLVPKDEFIVVSLIGHRLTMVFLLLFGCMLGNICACAVFNYMVRYEHYNVLRSMVL